MPWPTPQDYNEAVQSPKSVFADPELQSAAPETTKLGLPKAITGNFASVYRLVGGGAAGTTTGSARPGKEWAVRCFHRKYADRRNRYSKISQTLTSLRLPHMVPFKYLDEGIRVRGKWHPILKMEWVHGPLLTAYVEQNLAKPKAIAALSEKWRKMVAGLQSAGIAHGDLQHGNIIIVKGNIRLVDYDGMYVQSLAGMRSNETGHPNYQHPHRMGTHFGPHLDNFSAWAVYVSLIALADDPTLWEKTTRGDEALLFKRKDFEYPAQSRAFALLGISKDAEVRKMGARFAKIVRQPVSQVPPLDEKAPAPAPKKAAAPSAPPRPATKPAQPPAPPGPATKPAPKPAHVSAPPKPARKPPSDAWYVQPAAKSAPPGARPAAPGPAPPATPPGPGPAPPAAPPVIAPAAKAAPAAPKAAPPAVGPARPATPPAPGPAPKATPPAAPKAGSAAGSIWWLMKALARVAFTVTKWMLVCLWWLLRALAKGVYLVCRTFLWRLPRWQLSILAESYRKLPPPRRRRVQVAGALVVVALSAASYLWHEELAAAFAEVAEVVSRARAADSASEEETCEFLASPAARLYVDGELASGEIPPLYRTALAVGEHTVRFVSPSGSSREITIEVAKGRPEQWFMDFADGEVHRRAPVSTAE